MKKYMQTAYYASPYWCWRNSYYLNLNLFQHQLRKRENHDTFNTVKTTS
jgi:hypothetical protein